MKPGKLCASKIQEWNRHRIDTLVPEREKYKMRKDDGSQKYPQPSKENSTRSEVSKVNLLAWCPAFQTHWGRSLAPTALGPPSQGSTGWFHTPSSDQRLPDLQWLGRKLKASLGIPGPSCEFRGLVLRAEAPPLRQQCDSPAHLVRNALPSGGIDVGGRLGLPS